MAAPKSPFLFGDTMSEKEFQGWVTSAATRGGWKWWHFNDSRRQVGRGKLVGDTDAAGFPDLVLAKPGVGVLFVELKAEGNYPTPKQRAALNALADAGQLAAVWKPRDAETIEAVLLASNLAAQEWIGA